MSDILLQIQFNQMKILQTNGTRNQSKQNHFFKWHEQLKKDIALIFSEDLRISERNIRKAFGEKPTQVGIKVAFSANKPYATVTGVPHVVKISTPNRPYRDDLL